MKTVNSVLYSRLLGDDWDMLAENIRLAHSTESAKRGRFRVTHGVSWLARRMAKWSRLPAAAEGVETCLEIITEGQTERWVRRFGSDDFTTRQWEGKNGLLIEQFGKWELAFKLRVADGKLFYDQHVAKLSICGARIGVPRMCAPLVVASEISDGKRVLVSVNVTLPLVGRLISYEGYLEMKGTSS